jgi:hypothetical protein
LCPVFRYTNCLVLIYYLSNVNLLEFLKFVYLPATYKLAVKYMVSKLDTSLVMNYVYWCSTFSLYISI